MADMTTVRVQLDYPLEHVKDPVIYHLVLDYHLIPNIRRAQIDSHVGGRLVLEIEGEPADITAGLDYARNLGIAVTEIGSEDSWTI